MAIDAHCECATVLVAEPSTDCRNIYPRLNASRGKEMSKVMVSELRVIQMAACGFKALLSAVDRADEIFWLWWPFDLPVLQE
jgi:hypothetical protein